MNYEDELAAMLKQRDNPKTLPPQVGIVKSIDPLKISLLDGQIIVDSENGLICKSLVEGAKSAATVKINAYTVGAMATDSRGDTISNISIATKTNYDAELTYKDILAVGNSVLVISANKKFIVIDKIEVV